MEHFIKCRRELIFFVQEKILKLFIFSKLAFNILNLNISNSSKANATETFRNITERGNICSWPTCSVPSCASPVLVLENREISSDDLTRDWIVLLVFYATLRLLAFAAVKLKLILSSRIQKKIDKIFRKRKSEYEISKNSDVESIETDPPSSSF